MQRSEILKFVYRKHARDRHPLPSGEGWGEGIDLTNTTKLTPYTKKGLLHRWKQALLLFKL
ncbi:MAG: hypothetical protein C0439_07265 [Pseudomonas sp.]|nr:hypothetical protein [Pseudomonas sp.]